VDMEELFQKKRKMYFKFRSPLSLLRQNLFEQKFHSQSKALLCKGERYNFHSKFFLDLLLSSAIGTDLCNETQNPFNFRAKFQETHFESG